MMGNFYISFLKLYSVMDLTSKFVSMLNELALFTADFVHSYVELMSLRYRVRILSYGSVFFAMA